MRGTPIGDLTVDAGDERYDQRHDRADEGADRRPRRRTALRPVAQPEGARRKFVGLVVAAREEITRAAESTDMTLYTRALVALSLVAGLTLSLSAGQAPARQPAAPAVLTAAQAAAGQAVVHSELRELSSAGSGGQNEAPQLAGTNFRTSWRAKTTKDLIDYMSATMPPGKPSLARRNTSTSRRSSCGRTALPRVRRRLRRRRPRRSDRSRPDSLRRLPPSVRAAAAGGDGDGAPRAGATQASRGWSVQGEVKNYVPVTDAMLKNPPPSDWLMARRNYQALELQPARTRSPRATSRNCGWPGAGR